MPLFVFKRCVVVLGLTAEKMRRWFSFEKWEDRIFSKRGLPFDRLRDRPSTSSGTSKKLLPFHPLHASNSSVSVGGGNHIQARR